VAIGESAEAEIRTVMAQIRSSILAFNHEDHESCREDSISIDREPYVARSPWKFGWFDGMPGEPAKSEMSALKTGGFLTGAGNPFLTTTSQAQENNGRMPLTMVLSRRNVVFDPCAESTYHFR